MEHSITDLLAALIHDYPAVMLALVAGGAIPSLGFSYLLWRRGQADDIKSEQALRRASEQHESMVKLLEKAVEELGDANRRSQ